MLHSLTQGKCSSFDTLEALDTTEETQKANSGNVSEHAVVEPPKTFVAELDGWRFGLCADSTPLPVDTNTLVPVRRRAFRRDAQMITPVGPSPPKAREIPELGFDLKTCNGMGPDNPGYKHCADRKKAIQRATDILVIVIITAAVLSLALGILHLCTRYRRLQGRSRLLTMNVKHMGEVGNTYRYPPVVFSTHSSNIPPRTIKWQTPPHRAGRPVRDEELGHAEDERARYMAYSIDGTSDEGFFSRIFKKRGTAPTAVESPPVYAHRIPSLQLPNPELSVRLPPRAARRFSSGDVSLIGKRRTRHSVVGLTIPEESDVLAFPNGGRLRPSVGERRSTC